MKFLTILIFSMNIAMAAPNPCELWVDENDSGYVWGSSVDVAYHDFVALYQKTELPAVQLEVEISTFGDFSCSVHTISAVEPNCVEVLVAWAPGTDYSGCHLNLKSKVDRSYVGRESELFMNY